VFDATFYNGPFDSAAAAAAAAAAAEYQSV
jgi:hypothetical protein